MNYNFNIENFIRDFQKNCSKIQKKDFKKDEIITTYIEKRNQLCILISGSADLVRYDSNGNKTIVEHFTKYDVFGELFYIIATNNELFVKARQECEVLFFSYDGLKHKCKQNCKFHQTLSESLSELILNKVTFLNTRVELLTKRTIRDKILGYFAILSNRNFSNSFTIPFSLTDLADYLSIDRSAMKKKKKNLKDEGFIRKNGNKITLLYK